MNIQTITVLISHKWNHNHRDMPVDGFFNRVRSPLSYKQLYIRMGQNILLRQPFHDFHIRWFMPQLVRLPFPQHIVIQASEGVDEDLQLLIAQFGAFDECAEAYVNAPLGRVIQIVLQLLGQWFSWLNVRRMEGNGGRHDGPDVAQGRVPICQQELDILHQR